MAGAGFIIFRASATRTTNANNTAGTVDHVISTGTFHIVTTANPTVFSGSGMNDDFFISPAAYAEFLGKATEIARGDYVVING